MKNPYEKSYKKTHYGNNSYINQYIGGTYEQGYKKHYNFKESSIEFD